MTTLQQIVILLWLAPAVGFIVIPLLWEACGVLCRLVERSRLGEFKGAVAISDIARRERGEAEHRSRPRILVQEGGQARVAEECRSCKAGVVNISGNGICLENLSNKVYREPGPLRVVLRTRDDEFSIRVRPVWQKLTENGCTIGAEIENPPAGWWNLVTGLDERAAAQQA
ncbi:MAG: hypothetical protein Kow0089_13690 [Desulfobulbaceae bacterium]